MDGEIETPEDDPELAALLRFEPVPRKQLRASGGWSPENQLVFIRALVETGDYRQAADRTGLSANSVYQLRKEPGGEDFARAWEEAVALHRRRSGAASRARHQRGRPVHHARAANHAELEEAEKEALIAEIMKRYGIKLQAERRARLEGRIVEADYYVRQLSFIELVLDLGGQTQQLIEGINSGTLHMTQIVATPGSTLLEKTRRALWLEKGEADRPPPAPLGRIHGGLATGRDDYDPARDGDRRQWEQAQAEKRRLAAEAQAEWERRAREEAARRQDGTPWREDDPEERS